MRQKNLTKGFGLAATILFIILACSSLPFIKQGPSEQAPSQIVAEIPSCNLDSTVLCIVSFGVDNKNQMLISFIMPDESTSDFYLKVRNGETEGIYECQAIKDFPTHVYCAGKQLPIGEKVDIEVYSKGNDNLIAHGTFVITAIALPTPVIVTVTLGTPGTRPATVTRTKTPQVTITPSAKTPSKSTTPNIKTPSMTVTPNTKTPPATNSYPNSYP